MNTKTFASLTFLFHVCVLCNAQCLTDNFNSDYGNWEPSDTYRNTTAGHTGIGVGFNDKDDNITTLETINNPESISFLLSRSESSANRTLNVQYTTSLTGTWTNLHDILVDDVEEDHKQFTIPINLTGDYYLRIILSQRTGGSYYLDDVNVFCTPQNNAELQLIDEEGNYQNCGYIINFDSVPLNESATKTFTIKNAGDIDLNISNLETPSDFAINSPSFPLLVPPSSEAEIILTYTPTAVNTVSDQLLIWSNDANENPCSIWLSASSFSPEAEIDVERNTEASIPNGSSPNIGYNTIFSSTAIGEVSASKIYYIHNEGTSNLSITSITSSNPSEFIIHNNPGNTTLFPEEKVAFEIMFNPLNTGTRTSTITIINSDSDENPYIFQLRGTGTCPATNINIMPSLGPIGTTITVTGSDFGTLTTAKLNAISLDVNVKSSTILELTVPDDAVSGDLTITNDLNCAKTVNFNVLNNTTSGCEGDSGFIPTDLFISEISDHDSGSHSYIEIFNGTGAAISLDDYSIRIYNNGNNTPQHTIGLTGIINPKDVFVLAIGSSNSQDPHGDHGFDQSSTVTGVNTNDNIRLFKNETEIDLWGDTSGNDFTVSDKGYLYQRKSDLTNVPSTVWNPDDWLTFSDVDYTDIGSYNFKNGEAPSLLNQPNILTSTCQLSAALTVDAIEGFSGGHALSYQWFKTSPENTDWEAVSDDENLIGSNTATLSILNTIPVKDYQFYCQVNEPDATCHVKSKAVNIAIEKSVWTGTAWEDNILPNENSITLLTNDYKTIEHGNFATCSLVIPENVTLTISGENFISVANNVIVAGNIVVEDKGSFVQENNAAVISNSGTITVEKETAILNAWYEYTYWSSPVKDNIFADTFKNSRRLFWFDASNFADIYKEENNDNTQLLGQDDVDDNGNDWQAIGDGQTITKSDNLLAGVGYAATHTNTDFTAGETQTYTFTGTFNNGIIETPVSRNDESKLDNNWNLIGNPYPSAIDVDAFFEDNVYTVATPDNPLEGIIYLWSQDTPPSKFNNGNEVYNFSPSDYAIINGSGTIAAQDGSGKKPDRFIPSCQGFFVKFSDDYNAANATVKFNNSMRVTSGNTQFFRSENTNKIWLNLTSDNAAFSQTLISYLPRATDGYDGSYFDANTILTKSIPAKLYTTIPETDFKFVIQGKASESLNKYENIPIGFYSTIKTPTIFSISIDAFEGDFFEQHTIYLKDLFLNTHHNLKEAPYHFTSETGDFNNRFELVFKDNSLSINSEENKPKLEIVQLKNKLIQFKLNSDQFLIKDIYIYDSLGRVINHFKNPEPHAVYNLSTLQNTPVITTVSLSNGHVMHKKLLLK